MWDFLFSIAFAFVALSLVGWMTERAKARAHNADRLAKARARILQAEAKRIEAAAEAHVASVRLKMPRSKPLNDAVLKALGDVPLSRVHRYRFEQDERDAITLKGRAPWPREQWVRT